MADRHQYTAALRVASTELRLSELIGVLGEPTRGHDIGDPVSSRTQATRKHSMWSLVADLDRDVPLDEQIEHLVVFAEAHRSQLADIRPRCDLMDIFCGVFANDAQGGWELSPSLMGRLASMDLGVAFDLYSTAEPTGA
jgi:Domain of unknown function (DUF4279)